MAIPVGYLSINDEKKDTYLKWHTKRGFIALYAYDKFLAHIIEGAF